MGWMNSALQWFGYGIPPNQGTMLPASIFTEDSLQRIVLADLFDSDVQLPVSRSEAMSLGPVSRGRGIVCGTIATTPLELIDERTGERLPQEEQSWWLNHTYGVLSAFHRMNWTLDDGLFYGEAMWRVDRSPEGFIWHAEQVPYAAWTVEPDGSVTIYGKPVDPASVIYFPFHVEGFLQRAERTLRMALAVERGVEERATNPIPLTVIESKDPERDLEQPEAKGYVDAFRAARQAHGGAAAMYLPSFLGVSVYGERADSGHAIEARNALRLDFANHIGIAASRLEGSEAAASLTYTTQEGDQQELNSSTGLGPWMADITGRLSQDDITPPGIAVRFAHGRVMEADPAPAPVNELQNELQAPKEVQQA